MLLPYASDRPPKKPPLVVVTLVLVQFLFLALVQIIIVTKGPNLPVVWFANLSLTPATFHWWAPFSYSFLHENVFHLSANMLFLWVFGGSVEDALGWKRFLRLYIIAAVLTGLLQTAMAAILGGVARTMPIIGASGAVSTIVGVFAVRFYRSRIRFIGLPFSVHAILLLAIAMLLEMGVTIWQLLQHAPAALVSAHWAHVGGFILGVLWAQSARLMGAGRTEYLIEDARKDIDRGAPMAAVTRLEKVLQRQPGDLQAEAELGHAWALAGDRDQSLVHYSNAIAGWLRTGEREESGRRYAELASYFPGVSLEPAQQLAVASALESESPETAVKALESLLAKHPESTEAETARLRIGSILLNRMNAPGAAAKHLEEFIHRHPNSALRGVAEGLLRTARSRTT